jgi:hypothetical protein
VKFEPSRGGYCGIMARYYVVVKREVVKMRKIEKREKPKEAA